MATYATNRDLKDVFPDIDSFDTKTTLYGWVAICTHAGHTIYQASNTGLITTLFANGKDLTSFKLTESYTDSTINTAEAVDVNETAIDVSDGSAFSQGDVIRIDSEKMIVTGISSNTLTVTRGFFGTTIATHNTSVDVYIGIEWENVHYKWIYNEESDSVLFLDANSTNPNDSLMESGEDWGDIRTRYLLNSSKYLDSMLDGKLPREQFKDQDGNYDYIIVRTTALLACSFLIRAAQPTSEIADALFLEANTNIASLNDGSTKLSWQTTGDASMGVIREGSVSGSLRVIDTRGAYAGIYDRIGVKITTAGVIGTAVYSYWAGDSDRLGSERMNQSEDASYSDTINGNYQPVGNGLYIRFAGDTGDSATINDYWEIEVVGKNETADLGYPRSMRVTRR